MRPTALRAALLLALVALLLGACATAPEPPAPGTEEEVARAESLLEDGRTLAAVRVYRDLATQAEPGEAQRWRLRIVELLFDHGYPELALVWQRELDAQPVPRELRTRKRVVDARAAIVRRQGVLALRLLPTLQPDMPADLRARILDIRADAYGLTGQPGRGVVTRIRREALLDDEAAVDDNHEAIWNLLRGIPADRLRQLAETEDAPTLRGWAELALAVRSARMGRRPVGDALDRWRDRFEDHPAYDRFAATLRERVTAELTYPERIAVLLPLSGALAGPATAIRDGLLGAWYDQSAGGHKTEIMLYDTGADGLAPGAAYDRAVDDGAGFVIGPLAKSAVAELAARVSLEVPVLSLNYLPEGSIEAPLDLYQFGLLPEDEAAQSAEAAIQNNHFNAVALVPAGDWGDRMLGAFTERFEALGGVLLEAQRYDGDATDYGRPIQSLLNLDLSYNRERRLQSTIGSGVRFEPRRRQDIEVIFMAAQPRQARLLEPQLEFHRGGDLPTYASSHVFTGRPDPGADWDMNGLFFTETPWLLENLGGGSDPLYRAVQEHWPGGHQRFPRLHALGMDAFALLPYVQRLSDDRYAALAGRTGRLTVDEDNRVHRQLRWATFTRGRPVPLPRPEASAEEGELGEDVRERANGDS